MSTPAKDQGEHGSGRVSTGIEGLDEILHGGLIESRGYLLRGGPGSGKTLLGLRFLEAGVEAGEDCLLVTLEEAAEDLNRNAANVGISLDGVDVLDLSIGAEAFGPEKDYDVFSPEDVEAVDVTERIRDRLDEVGPDRVFLDPVTLLREIVPDSYRFRKQVLGLIGEIHNRGSTLIVTSQPGGQSGGADDSDLQYVTDGTIELERTDRFRLIGVPKFRGSNTRSGRHTMKITDEGIHVFPTLSPGVRSAKFTGEQASCGIPEIDGMLHGGLEHGTATIISGPTGVGKTTLGSQFMKEAASQGERSTIYLFEENEDTFLTRSEAIGTPVSDMLEEGTLGVREIEALNHSPEELGQMMRTDVEERGVRIVMIDGIAGYRVSAGDDESSLLPKLHSLVRYLKNQGVTVILIDEIAEIGAGFKATEGHISYLADNLVVLRHVELDGEIRKVIGVIKKRVSDFERQLREMRITSDGVKVGEPLTGLRGVLTGSPELIDERRGDGD